MARRRNFSNTRSKKVPTTNGSGDGQDLFRSCFSHAAIGFSIMDPDGRFLEVNPAYCAILGYTKAELRRLDVQTITHPDDLQKATANLQSLLAGDVPAFVIEKRKIRKNGDIIWVQNSVSLVRDSDRRPLNLVQLTQDITESRRRAENALRESEERYRELFENAKDAIYVHDLRGRYTSVNRAAEVLSGYSREEIIGKHYSNFVVPRDLAQVRTSFARKLDHVPETTYQVDVIRKDRRRVPVEVSSRLIYENGVPVGVQGMARDITERKRAEEARAQLALIVESSDDAIIGKTLDGIILSWNRGAEQMYGYSAREIIGCPITVVVPADRLGDVARNLAKIRLGESVKHFESLGRRKDGKLINVSLSVSPVKNAQGRIIGAATIARDITQHKQAEQVLKLST